MKKWCKNSKKKKEKASPGVLIFFTLSLFQKCLLYPPLRLLFSSTLETQKLE